MAKKPTKTAEEKNAAEHKLEVALSEKGYVSKSDLKAAAGKEPEGAPNVGRLGKGGTSKGDKIIIKPQRLERFQICVMGKESLIIHAWGPKAVATMLAQHMGFDVENGVKKPVVREEKEPFEDFLGSLYGDREGYFGFPSNAFKAAMVGACRHHAGVTMTNLRECVHVLGDLTPIYGMPQNRLDPVEIGKPQERVADLRFRGEFPVWLAELTIQYDADIIDQADVLNLIARAGAVGVGEWRPGRSGNHGIFELVQRPEQAEQIKAQLGRYRKQDMTVENSGTIQVLANVGLDKQWLERKARREAEALANPTMARTNGH